MNNIPIDPNKVTTSSDIEELEDALIQYEEMQKHEKTAISHQAYLYDWNEADVLRKELAKIEFKNRIHLLIHENGEEKNQIHDNLSSNDLETFINQQYYPKKLHKM